MIGIIYVIFCVLVASWECIRNNRLYKSGDSVEKSDVALFILFFVLAPILPLLYISHLWAGGVK